MEVLGAGSQGFITLPLVCVLNLALGPLVWVPSTVRPGGTFTSGLTNTGPDIAREEEQKT